MTTTELADYRHRRHVSTNLALALLAWPVALYFGVRELRRGSRYGWLFIGIALLRLVGDVANCLLLSR